MQERTIKSEVSSLPGHISLSILGRALDIADFCSTFICRRIFLVLSICQLYLGYLACGSLQFIPRALYLDLGVAKNYNLVCQIEVLGLAQLALLFYRKRTGMLT